MKHFDIESAKPDNPLSADDENENDDLSSIFPAARRRQNAWFAFGLAVCLFGAAALVLSRSYESPNLIPADLVFDADGGEVGNDAPNAKTQQLNDESQQSTSNIRSNPFHAPHQFRDDFLFHHQGDFIRDPSNRTRIKQQAVLDAWNRTHPGEPLPDSLNFSLYASFGADFHNPKRPMDRPGHHVNHDPRHPETDMGGAAHFFPTKTNEDSGQVEDSSHDLDVHNDEPPVPVPTSIPTPAPILVVTPVPTLVPAPDPTPVPTPVPSPAPTLGATPDPTPVPTPVPTPLPTPVPTLAPTPVVEATPSPVELTTVKATSTSRDQEIAAWHAATVTTDSGRTMFEVVDQLRHDHNAFTQGLTFANGKLYESAGLYGQSSIRILDPNTGDAVQIVPIDRQYFAEGMTFYKDKLIQIVWKKAKGFVYDANNIAAPPIEYTYKTTKDNEGWGLTYDSDRGHLVVTDGSANLIFWDPDCWQTGHCAPLADRPPIQVKRLNGQPALELNEIEYWRGRILANIWYSDVLLVINPESGKVEKEYDFRPIFPKRNPDADVFNGISVSDDPDVLYVTGKKWDRIFKVKLLV